MIKKLYTLIVLAFMSAPLLAQTIGSNDGVIFAPQKGQWQVSMFFGGGNKFYNEKQMYELLPNFTNTGGSVGLPNGSTSTSGDLNTYLNIDGLNGNNLTNILGFEGKYFLSDCWDINLQFSMDINLTPKKDYVEGDYTVGDMIIPAQKYINAQMTNNWYVGIGSNHYFKTSNPRIHPYLGASVGFQMARIETSEPYTGDTYLDDDLITDEEGNIIEDAEDIGGLPTQVYVSGSRAGQMFGIKAASVAGIEYSVAPGLVLGFQFQPVAYRYDVIQICPKGFDKYNASHHNIKLFDMAVLKLGIRF
ncbi:BT1926 family outer membrane beta-barrel protein [Phocaeicola barnesiae]|uniref:BT1926 family outer membrane beta-barrel protein n=1 Tax=Phocaeicola barnesiae TaxID=376804 RepID=UPI0025A3C13B|nr:BT1926 family outer membrane beta-barrel protein [Phocaeicola barnesiae]MDM8242716.1 BT1926 family outer membrane beta-barrel protein [Phocaeicola barnesiae]